MFFSPTRPVREFSLAELVAKVSELAQRQQGDPSPGMASGDGAARTEGFARGDSHRSDDRFEAELTE